MTYPLRFTSVFLIVLLLASAAGCKSIGRTEKGAAIGAGAGAIIGGVIGKATGKTTRGVLIGTAVGGAAGAIIGRQMDKQAEELDEELEGATVERVGEGIQITFDSAILFAVDSAELSETSIENLGALAESLQEYPNTDVMIVGHTDSTGPEAYNQDLSERRAASAARLLLEQGIAPERLGTTGYGETQPIASNDTAVGRQQNRRVEVAIYASEEYREEVMEETQSGR